MTEALVATLRRDVAADETAAHLLMVDDDRELAAMLAQALSQHGFRVSRAGNAAEMDRARRADGVDLFLLDVMLPGEDGLSICQRLRQECDVPILMLTAMGEEAHRVLGLELGADDYVTKPFSSNELVARVRALLRRTRTGGRAGAQPALAFGGWRLDPATRQLRDPGGVRVVLTAAEFDLLLAFVQNPDRLLSRDQLLDLTRGREAAPFDRSVDILVSRLRRKLEADPRQPTLIVTVRSGGYMFWPKVRPLP